MPISSQVSLQMMRERNEEFEAKMNSVERASKELRLVLMQVFTCSLLNTYANQIDRRQKVRGSAGADVLL